MAVNNLAFTESSDELSRELVNTEWKNTCM